MGNDFENALNKIANDNKFRNIHGCCQNNQGPTGPTGPTGRLFKSSLQKICLNI